MKNTKLKSKLLFVSVSIFAFSLTSLAESPEDGTDPLADPMMIDPGETQIDEMDSPEMGPDGEVMDMGSPEMDSPEMGIDPMTEDPVLQQIGDDPEVEAIDPQTDPIVNDPVIDDPMMDLPNDPMADDPIANDPAIDLPDDPEVEAIDPQTDPIVNDPMIDLPDDPIADPMAENQIIEDEPILAEELPENVEPVEIIQGSNSNENVNDNLNENAPERRPETLSETGPSLLILSSFAVLGLFILYRRKLS